MTYLKYANLCAEVLRGSLKEPFLTKARAARTAARPECLALLPPGRVRAAAAERRGCGAQAKPRESVYFKSTPYVDGKQGKAGAHARCAVRSRVAPRCGRAALRALTRCRARRAVITEVVSQIK